MTACLPVVIGCPGGIVVECRTCDQEVAGLSLSWAPRRKNSGQVSHTYVPLSPSSITWYRSKGSCLATGEQTNCGLCVGGRLKTVWSLITHGPSLTSRCCPAWQLRLSIAVLRDRCWLSMCLDWNKVSLLLLLLYITPCFRKKTPTHIIGYKLRSSCLILIFFDIKIPHIIWHRMTA